MTLLTTLLIELKRLLGDDLGFIWDDDTLYDALKNAQVEYLRRTRSWRALIEVEAIDSDNLISLPDNTVNIEYAHNSDQKKLGQLDYYSALRSQAGLLDTEFGKPLAIYNSKGCDDGIKAFPNCLGTLEIYTWSDNFGLTLSLENFEITGGDWGLVGNEFGIINIFRDFDGEKITVNVSLNPESDAILVRFPDALIWRASSELLLERKETEDISRSGIFQQVFDKYVTDDIRLLKRRIGIKAQGEYY